MCQIHGSGNRVVVYVPIISVHATRKFGSTKCTQFLQFELSHDKTNKMICAPSEEADQHGHPPSLIRVFDVRMKKHWALSYLLSALRRLWSDWADVQADLSIRWAQKTLCWFWREAAHFNFIISNLTHIPSYAVWNYFPFTTSLFLFVFCDYLEHSWNHSEYSDSMCVLESQKPITESS